MPNKKLSNKQVGEVVNSEGLGYAVQFYMGADKIKDPVLAEKWKAAAEALRAIDAILEKYYE